MNHNPPNLFLRFFRWFCHPKLKKYIEGDLMELYDERLKQSGKRKADLKFIIDVLLLFRPGIIRPEENRNLNHYDMFRNYLKIGWRNLSKNKGYSSINIIGLAAGMTVAILIGLWIFDEVSFNSNYQNHKNIVQVMLNQTNDGITYTGDIIAPTIEPGLRTKYGNDFKALVLVSIDGNHIISLGDKNLSANGSWVQQDFPEMFTLSMLSGSRSILKDPSTILISQSLAKAVFGDVDPLGKTVRMDSHQDMIVGGVYEDMPHNSTFYNTQLLLPWNNKQNWLNTITDWDNHSCRMFAQLSDHTQINTVSDKIKNLPTPHISAWKEEISLYALDNVHLYNEFINGKAEGGRIQFVKLVGFIGMFVLLLACINFMNLSTARSEKRAKEVGVRKTVGSQHNQLIAQFLTESIITSFASLVIAIILTQLTIPFFNVLADKNISIHWQDPVFWLAIIAFTLFCGIISGSYPAFYLSSFRPLKVLKGTFKAGRMATLPRKVLVVVQFTVSITLILGTVIVYKQIQFAKDRPAGYNRNGLITIGINSPDLQKHYDVIRNELIHTGVIENVAESSQSAAHFGNNNSIEWPGKDHSTDIFFRDVCVTPDFGKTIGWTIKEGRDFSADIASDSSATIINETAAKIMGLKNPIGEKIKYFGKEFTITGIVNDMLTQSPYEPNEPSIFFMKGWLGVITIRIKPTASIHTTLTAIEPIFKKYNPNAPFEYSFVDQDYARKFSDEERIGNLATFFAALAIFISCLGLFGLASFVAEQRTKEIGIRKTLGASVMSLWQLLSKDFIMLVILSFVISIPISFLFMNNWLQQYVYRTTLSWYLFAAVGMGALIIALITVSLQSVKAAMLNPVKSLRSE